MKTDILIIGSGCSGLYCALQLPADKQITIITKADLESSDSFLAQGGMCMLKSDSDYDSYFEDTMKAGHYENDKKSVDIMIRSSQDVVKDLLSYGVDFKRDEDGALAFTREGAHSTKRILFHEDIICRENICYGAVIRHADGTLEKAAADYTVFATGGVGGLYRHSTNFRHLTGDALAVSIRHHIDLKDINYIQIHPTTLYSEKPEDRSFLISESVRGEGAKLYDKNMNRFVNELLPRDLLTEAILAQMEKDQTEFVWEDLRTIPEDELKSHFPNIVEHCREMGYDVTKECIPVVPAQHYFMGGIRVNHRSRTSMEQLYAVGETACNGVHGKNRLASNSLLESLVFAKRAAKDMQLNYPLIRKDQAVVDAVDLDNYENEDLLEESYKKQVLKEIEKANQASKSA